MVKEPTPYPASPDELRAIDEGLSDDAIPEVELPAAYRTKAAQLRCKVGTAETIEMRVALLDAAERFDQLATDAEQRP